MLDGGTRSRSRYYVTAKLGVTVAELVRRETGLSYLQIKRLQKMSNGLPFRAGDLNMSDHAFERFVARVRVILPWLGLTRHEREGLSVSKPSLSKLRKLLEAE